MVNGRRRKEELVLEEGRVHALEGHDDLADQHVLGDLGGSERERERYGELQHGIGRSGRRGGNGTHARRLLGWLCTLR